MKKNKQKQKRRNKDGWFLHAQAVHHHSVLATAHRTARFIQRPQGKSGPVIQGPIPMPEVKVSEGEADAPLVEGSHAVWP